MQRLRRLQSAPLGFATVDLDRKQRCGVGEVIFAEGKLPQQVVEIARTILDREGRVLITRGPTRTRRCGAGEAEHLPH